MKTQTHIPVSAYKSGGFIGRYQKLIRETVIPHQYKVLCDKAEDTEKSHVIKNFVNAGKALRNQDTEDGFYGMVFQDSDAAKWIEAAAYSLAVNPDAELENTVDGLIDIIADAQDSDGYLNTFFTVKDKDKRWTNLLEGHELYCSGHMIEAACAYFEATGKDKLLRVMEKNAEHIYEKFIIGKTEGYPGHPEIELALLRLFRTTGNPKFLELSAHFLDVRGVDSHFFEKECKKRTWQVWGMSAPDTHYNQSYAPVREQKDAVGHSVRAAYLYTAMADMASQADDKELFAACRRLWESITQKRMYITGGIGSTVIGEAFSVDYDLPNDTAYAETCASIALIFFASQMLTNEIRGEYADIMEKAFYNTVLGSIQLDGKRFFYVNPLEIIPGISGEAQTHRHALPVRPKWYACACCPPNAARLISSFGRYAYGEDESTAYCHMFADGEVSFGNGIKLRCETDYPYGFSVKYTVKGSGRLAVRIPGWSEKYEIRLNRQTIHPENVNGYVYIEISHGDCIEIQLDGDAKKVYPSAKIPKLSGCVAVTRGPLVYCFEGADNEGDVVSLSLKSDGAIHPKSCNSDALGDITLLETDAVRTEGVNEGLYSYIKPKLKEFTAVAVPYYTWGNRGENQMRVWMNEK